MIVERRTGKGSWMRKLVQLGLCGAGGGGGEFITLFEILSNSVRTSETIMYKYKYKTACCPRVQGILYYYKTVK